MPETLHTHREIVKIRKEIEDIKRAQEADMQLSREKYERLVSLALHASMTGENKTPQEGGEI